MKKFVQANKEAKEAVTVIVSANSSELTEGENKLRTARLGAALTEAGIKKEPCTGVWDGQVEDGFVCSIPLEKLEQLGTVLKLAEENRQDFVLYKDKTGVFLVSVVTHVFKRMGDDIRLIPDDAKDRFPNWTKTARGYWIVE